jgi:hypothetical protein
MVFDDQLGRLDFNQARLMFIEVLAAEMGLPILEIVTQYNEGGELKRRIDIAASYIAGKQDYPPSLSGRGIHSKAIH